MDLGSIITLLSGAASIMFFILWRRALDRCGAALIEAEAFKNAHTEVETLLKESRSRAKKSLQLARSQTHECVNDYGEAIKAGVAGPEVALALLRNHLDSVFLSEAADDMEDNDPTL